MREKLSWYRGVQNKTLVKKVKQLHPLVSSVHWTLFQKSCGLFRCSFVNLSHACVFFWERSGLLLATLLNKPYFFSLFLIVLSWTLINMLTGACRVSYVALGFFLSTAQSNLLGHPLLRKWHVVTFASRRPLVMSLLRGIYSGVCWHTPECSRTTNSQNARFYRGLHTCWWPFNQGLTISRTWL